MLFRSRMQPIPITVDQLTQWMLTIVALAGVLSPLVLGVTEATKKVLGEEFPARFYPALSIVWGLIIGWFVSWVLVFDIRVGVIVGFIAGLIACGLFQYGKNREAE